MAIHDKTQTQCSKLQIKALYKNNAHYKIIQPNYYPSVASVDSSTTKWTYIFLEILNKCINACVENISKTKNKFLTSQNTKQGHVSWITHKYKSMSSETRNIDNNVSPPNMNSPKTIHQEPKRIHTQWST